MAGIMLMATQKQRIRGRGFVVFDRERINRGPKNGKIVVLVVGQNDKYGIFQNQKELNKYDIFPDQQELNK